MYRTKTRFSRTWQLGLVLSLCAAACSDDGGNADVDAGDDVDAPDAPVAVSRRASKSGTIAVTNDDSRVLMVNPEICSGHLNFTDRDSHFIFGDVATAVIVEEASEARGGWDIVGTRLKTHFSNNIRNNFGFLNRAAPEGIGARDKLFVQEGRKVFKEVVPMVSEMIVAHARDLGIDPTGLKRLWLHQANINMNEMIGRKVLGRDPEPGENVIILDRFANTSSAGSIIAFHTANSDFAAGEIGLICSFGAGYSAGTVFVRKR